MTRYEVEFEVEFLMGKQRPRFDPRTKRAYTPSETKDAEYQVGVAYKGASIRRYGRVVRAPRGVPVAVRVDCYTKAPRSWPKWLPTWLKPRMPFTKKVDVDNALKLVMDGMNGIAYDDDAQVIAVHAFKHDMTAETCDRMELTIQFDLEEQWETSTTTQ